jgi:hypothetical protein
MTGRVGLNDGTSWVNKPQPTRGRGEVGLGILHFVIPAKAFSSSLPQKPLLPHYRKSLFFLITAKASSLSFPRKRESRKVPARFDPFWIPACAGMTGRVGLNDVTSWVK